MESDRRIALAERRRFMQQRNEARELRSEIEPAWSALEAASEDFHIHRLGAEPSWCPDWVPSGYSEIPWRMLDGAHFSAPGLDRPALATVARDLLAERLSAADRMLLVPEGKRWSIWLPRAAFDRHAEALLEAAWDRAYLAAPPARWLVQLDGHSAVWKDG